MRPVAVALALCGALACTDDDPDDRDDAGLELESDVDAGTDGGADAFPQCPGEDSWFWAHVQADPNDHPFAGGRPMVVVGTADTHTLFVLEDDLSCDPPAEVRIFLEGSPVPPEVWLPPERSTLVAVGDEGYDDFSVVLRSPEGVLVWEAASATAEPAQGSRFRLIDDPDAPFCIRGGDSCILRAPIRMGIETDDGEVELASGEHAIVTIEGEPFVAFAASAERTFVTDFGCVDDYGGGLYGEGYVARTSAVDLPLVDRPPPPSDGCPETMPVEYDPCTTAEGERCDYDVGNGCLDTYECRGCVWNNTVRSIPDDVDCGFDRWDCMTNGDDGGCSEEAVCTDCSCPGDSRWRCLDPGAGCPACP